MTLSTKENNSETGTPRSEKCKLSKEFAMEYEKLPNCDSHYYATKKKIKPNLLRQDAKGNLIITVHDKPDGEIVGWQTISPDGTKGSASGTKIQGSCHLTGKIDSKTKVILIAEGYATAYALHKSTGDPCLVTFGTSNLMAVTEKTVSLYPSYEITICADNDQHKADNTGLNKAKAVAETFGLKLAIPNFDDLVSKPTDYWDLWNMYGAERVRNSVAKAAKIAKMPKNFSYKDGNLCWANDDLSKKICIGTAIYVDAYSADEEDSNHSLILRWPDYMTGKIQKWVMPRYYLEEPIELRKHLLSNGYKFEDISKASNSLLLEFLHKFTPDKRILSVNKTGWHDNSFVLPHKIHPMRDDMILNNLTSAHAKFEQSGTLKEWQDNIAKYCEGNHKLILAICLAFTAPLQKIMGLESFGVHYLGNSSVGKTTTLKVISSVWGNEIKTWRATANALEYVAASHNDTVLLLDELGMANPREIGQTIYTLANGQGKARLQSSITARKPFEWKTVFVSSGEVTLEDKIKETGSQSYAGQNVRMMNIPADSEMGFGIYHKLHGFKGGAELSGHFSDATKNFKGVAADAFLASLVKDDLQLLKSKLEHSMKVFTDLAVRKNYDGQVKRVADNFALAYAAGVLAIDYDIIYYTVEEVQNSILECFNDWLEHRETSSSFEERKLIQQVRYFFEKNHASRFMDIYESDDIPAANIQNQAGYKERTPDGYEFFVTPEIFKTEVIKGFNRKFAVKTLSDSGILITPCGSNSNWVKKRIPCLGKSIGVYHFSDKVFEGSSNIVDFTQNLDGVYNPASKQKNRNLDCSGITF